MQALQALRPRYGGCCRITSIEMIVFDLLTSGYISHRNLCALNVTFLRLPVSCRARRTDQQTRRGATASFIDIRRCLELCQAGVLAFTRTRSRPVRLNSEAAGNDDTRKRMST